MTTTTLEPTVQTMPPEELGKKIVHLVDHCTDFEIAVCGQDVSAGSWVPVGFRLPAISVCAVCQDLWPDGAGCPRCGCLGGCAPV